MIFKGLICALRTLTTIPVPGKESNQRYFAIPWFLFSGVLVGGIQVFVGSLFVVYVPSLMVFSGLFLTGMNYLLTGGLHLDGLADYADAFCTTQSKTKTLVILKDPHMGTFGTAAIVMAVIWRIIAYHHLIYNEGLWWILITTSSARIVQGILIQTLPYARDNQGKAFGYKGPLWITMILIFQVISIVMIMLLYYDFLSIVIYYCTGVIFVILSTLITMKRIHGITGDCIGAASELFELSFMTGVIAHRIL